MLTFSYDFQCFRHGKTFLERSPSWHSTCCAGSLCPTSVSICTSQMSSLDLSMKCKIVVLAFSGELCSKNGQAMKIIVARNASSSQRTTYHRKFKNISQNIGFPESLFENEIRKVICKAFLLPLF